MKGTIRLDHLGKNIYISSAYARAAMNIESAEYKTLQTAMRDHPEYAVQKREIKKNPHKECYRGLTYEYMDHYIDTHDESGDIRKIYDELRLRAKCHSVRYAHIKQWFLRIFPEIDDFSVTVARNAIPESYIDVNKHEVVKSNYELPLFA